MSASRSADISLSATREVLSASDEALSSSTMASNSTREMSSDGIDEVILVAAVRERSRWSWTCVTVVRES